MSKDARPMLSAIGLSTKVRPSHAGEALSTILGQQESKEANTKLAGIIFHKGLGQVQIKVPHGDCIKGIIISLMSPRMC